MERENEMMSNTGPININRVKNIKIQMDAEKKRIMNVDPKYSYMESIEGKQVLGLIVRGTFLKNLMLEVFHPIAEELVNYVSNYEAKYPKSAVIVFAFNDIEDNIQSIVSAFLKAYAEKSNRIPREYLSVLNCFDSDMEFVSSGFGPIPIHNSKDLTYYILNYYAENRKQLTVENIDNDEIKIPRLRSIGVYRFAKITQEEKHLVSKTGPIDASKIKKFLLLWNQRTGSSSDKKTLRTIDEDYSYMNSIEGCQALGVFIPIITMNSLLKIKHDIAQELIDYVDEYERHNSNTIILLFIYEGRQDILIPLINEFLKVYREKSERNPLTYFQTLDIKNPDQQYECPGFGLLKKHKINPLIEYFNNLAKPRRAKLTIDSIEQHKLDFSNIIVEAPKTPTITPSTRANQYVEKPKIISVYRFRKISDMEKAMISSTGPINKDRIRNIKFSWKKTNRFDSIDEEYSYMDSIPLEDKVLFYLVDGKVLDKLVHKDHYDQARLLDRHIRKIEENHPGEVVHLLASYNFEKSHLQIIDAFFKAFGLKNVVNFSEYLRIVSYEKNKYKYETIGLAHKNDDTFLSDFFAKLSSDSPPDSSVAGPAFMLEQQQQSPATTPTLLFPASAFFDESFNYDNLFTNSQAQSSEPPVTHVNPRDLQLHHTTTADYQSVSLPSRTHAEPAQPGSSSSTQPGQTTKRGVSMSADDTSSKKARHRE